MNKVLETWVLRLSSWMLIGLLILAALQAWHYYPVMPENRASHFDGSGHPDGYQSKAGFFGLCAAMLGMLALVFLVMPKALSRLPASWISLPNREYWLSPERKDSTVGWIGTQLEWFGAATFLFTLFVVQIVIQANLRDDRHMDAAVMWWLLGVYSLYAMIWLYWLVRRFKRTSS